MAHYVAHLVIPTALDQVPLAEHVADGAAQCLGAIDHEQPAPVRLQPALDQRLEQARRDGGVLGWAFARPSTHVLPAGRIDAHRGQHVVVPEHDPVEVCLIQRGSARHDPNINPPRRDRVRRAGPVTDCPGRGRACGRLSNS